MTCGGGRAGARHHRPYDGPAVTGARSLVRSRSVPGGARLAAMTERPSGSAWWRYASLRAPAPIKAIRRSSFSGSERASIEARVILSFTVEVLVGLK